MSQNSRVVWSDGMFLAPNHFQQMERHWQHQLSNCISASSPFMWGLSQLIWDVDALEKGVLRIQMASGISADGTYFCIPNQDSPPNVLESESLHEGDFIYICIPQCHAQVQNLHRSDTPSDNRRFYLGTENTKNIYEDQAEDLSMEIAKLHVYLASGKSAPKNTHAIKLAQIKRIHSSTAIELMPSIYPTSIKLQASTSLCDRIHDLSRHVGIEIEQLEKESLSLDTPGGELGQLLLLQVCKRYHTTIEHYITQTGIHPYWVWLELLRFQSELMLFTPNSGMSKTDYAHDDLSLSFNPLLQSIFDLLALGVKRAAHPIPLTSKSSGLHIGSWPTDLDTRSLRTIICVRPRQLDSSGSTAILHNLKLGPSNKIRELVKLNLPGALIRQCERIPRGIPARREDLIFEIVSTQNPLWLDCQRSEYFALHIPTSIDINNVSMWAISK